eukprot:TRINITY_DN6174_c1_g1_i1.p1 TRINITY_DN6174_c1_g1~~TRINITY_DN6174_c1_g1_i1.p1  ORF type:complete len:663 (+),score=109.96 TRINITY_DN6174_c1_g1_i1:85-1989(+)
MPCQYERWLVEKALRPGESAQERRAKEILLPVLPIVSAFTLISAASTPLNQGTVLSNTYGTIVVALWSLGAVAGAVFTRRLPIPFMEVTMVAFTVATVLVDWAQHAGMSTRVWPWVVMLMDVMLALRVRKAVQFFVMGMTIFWLVVSATEDAYRLGLYDISGWSEMPQEVYERRTDCSNAPCARGAGSAVIGLGVGVVPLVVDYMATRGFADGMEQQSARLLAAIQLAEQIADHLVRFDLESARMSLESRSDTLPSALLESFNRLLRNLASYKPYLPQSCLEAALTDVEGADSDYSHRTSISSSNPRVFPSSPSFTAEDALPVQRRLSRVSQATSSAASSVPGVRVKTASRTLNVAQTRRLTMLQCNRSGFLAAIADKQAVEVSEWLAEEVVHFAAAVAQQKGIMDLVSGDHLFASFGAVRPLGTHAVAALRCADALHMDKVQCRDEITGKLGALPATAGVTSGRALCGDFGSAAAQRFMVLGRVSSMLPALERAAAAWDAGILCDDRVREDTETHWDFRVRAMVTFGRSEREKPAPLWELMRQKPDSGARCDEWMYEMESARPNPWNVYNHAVTAWFKLQGTEALRLARSADAAEGTAEELVARALAALASSIESGQQPPTGVLGAVFPPAPV